jgi:hypothetical protein
MNTTNAQAANCTAPKNIIHASRIDQIANEISHLVSEIQTLLSMLEEDTGWMQPADWPPRRSLSDTPQQPDIVQATSDGSAVSA